jgi:predicted amidohydrolase YtcJ
MERTLFRAPLIRLDAAGRTARSMLVDRGRVSAVDPDVVPPGTAVVDLPWVVAPGFVDTHPHLLHFALAEAACVRLFDAVDHADVVARLARRAAATPPGEWLMATPIGEPHYFAERSWRTLAEGTMPDRHVLDLASREHPIMIQAWSPTCPNVCALNSAGLRALGIDRSTPDPDGCVQIERDDGEPTGRLWGSVNTNYNPDPYFQSLLDKMPAPAVVDPAAALEDAIGAAHRRGVTAVFEPHAMELRHVDIYRRLREAGRLRLRVAAVPELQRITRSSDPRKTPDELRDTLQAARDAVHTDDPWLRVFGVCVSSHGGTPNTGSMPHPHPYRDPLGTMTTGTWALDRDAVADAVRFCDRTGLRLNACTIGIAEIDLLLDLIDEVGADATGWIIQHGVLMRPDQIERVAQHRMMITYCAGFTPGLGGVLAERFDDDAVSYLNPVRRWLDAGIPLAAATDWGPVDPLAQMQLAAELHGLSPGEAFRAWTQGGASVLEWPEIGSLTEGSNADFVCLSADLVTSADPVAVTSTFVAGEQVASGRREPAR